MPRKVIVADAKVEKKSRTRRSIETREAELDAKIRYHEDCIAALRTRKDNLHVPRATRLTFKTVIEELKASGKTPEEILELLQK